VLAPTRARVALDLRARVPVAGEVYRLRLGVLRGQKQSRVLPRPRRGQGVACRAFPQHLTFFSFRNTIGIINTLESLSSCDKLYNF
jgi:hypothetical protein